MHLMLSSGEEVYRRRDYMQFFLGRVHYRASGLDRTRARLLACCLKNAAISDSITVDNRFTCNAVEDGRDRVTRRLSVT